MQNDELGASLCAHASILDSVPGRMINDGVAVTW